jgi:hypothetical protein
MRSYIFTPLERRILQRWLQGQDTEPKVLSVILARVRGFEALASDVELYLSVRRRLKAKPSKTAST